jgi:hypothetical protein
MTFTLEGELPALTAAIEHLRTLATADGIAFETADFGGVRTEADTVRILKYRDDDYAVYVKNLAKMFPGKTPTAKEIWRPIAPFGSSMHNYGAARDLKITERPASMTEAEALRRLGSHAPDCGLKWGGTFTKKVDPPHMELAISLAEAKRLHDAASKKAA